MNTDKFYALAKVRLFGGKITSEQDDGLNAILRAFRMKGTGDKRHLAYLLATAYHETGKRMIAVREGQGQRAMWSDAQARKAVALLFKKGKIRRNYALPGSYGNSFYGRGMAQITHEENYKRLGDIIGIDLVRYPDKALDNDVAAFILVEGSLRGISLRGDFTKYALEDFIVGAKCDYVNARQVINRLDRANDIAGYALKFEECLTGADYEHVPFKGKRKEKAEPSSIPSENELFDIQTRLKGLGYHEIGKVDGLWGNKTQTAVLAFRAENDLPLVKGIDDEFRAALWKAQPRLVSDNRATAKLKDLKGVAPGASELDFVKKAASFAGVGSVVSGGALSTEGVNDLTEKVTAVKSLMDILPSPSTLILIGVGAAVVYWLATRVGAKVVRAYREGSVS